MLTIKFTPVKASQCNLSAGWLSPVLTINGNTFDLSLLQDGAVADGHAVLRKVSRSGNDYEVTLKLPHLANSPHERRFPEDVVMRSNGAVLFPPLEA